MLEENIAQLQKRIRELEDASNEHNVPSIPLIYPYTDGHPINGTRLSSPSGLVLMPQNGFGGISGSQPLTFEDNWATGSSHSGMPLAHPTPTTFNNNGAFLPASSVGSSPRPSLLPFASTSLEEPTVDVVHHLYQTFEQHAPLLGLFLDSARLREEILSPLPLGHQLRPAPSLVFAIYLWGAHLSSTPIPLPYDKQMFLENVLLHLGQDLSGSHPHKILHVIQAEVLLSYYFLNQERVFEGSYHASAALSLAFSAKLHLVRSGSQTSMSGLGRQIGTFPGADLGSAGLSNPLDLIEECERINAFWSVVMLNNYWVAMHGAHPCTPMSSPHLRIDTPWPLDGGDMTNPLPLESVGTVKKFLEGASVEGFSISALHIKASILLEQATSLSTALRNKGPHEDPRAASVSILNLNQVIERFKNNLPLVDGFHENPLARYKLCMTHLLTYIATIRLYCPFAEQSADSREKCVSAAVAITQCTSALCSSTSMTYPDPIIGLAGYLACEVLLKDFFMTNRRGKQLLVDSFQTITTQMSIFALSNPLIQSYLNRVQRLYTELSP
ncbi:hypothetical protein AX16_005793 [Volvariella volvacea WC 439]|nr:hypothetical protein AX16_005793 [Volvariella volvacea WC 439]